MSPYLVEKESSNFKIGSVKPISFTEHAPTKYNGDKVSYGSYENQKPFTKVFFYNFLFLIIPIKKNFVERN